MDFELSPETEALRDLTAGILTDRSTAERLSELDRQGEWLDRRTWAQLADAGIVGVALPEDVGGAGMGFLELHQALEQVGATVAQVPLWETVVLGALPVARHGSTELQQRLLPGVVGGETLLTAALLEPAGADSRAPRTTAVQVDGGWRLRGAKTQVPLAAQAHRVLVPATTDDGRTGVFLVDPADAGVTLEAQASVSLRPVARMTLDDARAEPLTNPDDGAVLDDLLLHAQAGLAAVQAGVCAAALRRAAEYTSGREQFGRPIGTFQAVRQRLADGYIDVEGIRLTSLQAAWQLAEGMDASRAVGIAKYWAADAGHRVLYTAQHVHGGMGIDLDYPLHRYFRYGKYVELTLGPAGEQLRRLGRRFAEQG